MLNGILGLSVAIVGGMIVVGSFSYIVKRIYRDSLPPETNVNLISVNLIGGVERLFFALAIGFELSGAIGAMIGWITLKMALNHSFLINFYVKPSSNMKQFEQNLADSKKHRTRAFIGLLSAVLSMLCAIIGGIIIREQLFLS